MSQDELILLFFKISIIAVIVTAIGFVVMYTKLAPWWKSPIGRTIVWKDILLVLALIPSAVSLFFTLNRMTSHLVAWFDIGDFFLIAAVMVARCRVWYTVHRAGASELEELADEPGT